MKRLFLLPVFLFPVLLFAQCIDSLVQPNPYAHCGSDYRPVCACDENTYRNDCAALNFGAILPGQWVDGPCDNFDIDFFPNPVSTYEPELRVYMKSAGAIQVLIYSAFGILNLERNYYMSNSSTLPLSPLANIDFKDLQKGIYILVVVVNGERKTKKITRLGI